MRDISVENIRHLQQKRGLYYSILVTVLVVACLLLEPHAVNAATITVTTAQDELNPTDGVLSLREAIATAAPGDTIVFAPSLAGQSILLTLGELLIEKDLIIGGPGSFYLAIDANTASRVLRVADGTVVISGVTITHGRVLGNPITLGSGGAGILNEKNGTVNLIDAIVTDNDTLNGDGGGIVNSGLMAIFRSTVSNNRAGFTSSAACNGSILRRGGGIYNEGSMTADNSTISGNKGCPGGGIYNTATLTINNSTIANNIAGGEHGFLTLGGGIYTLGELDVNNSTISGNRVMTLVGQPGQGGGIWGSADIQNDIISGNFRAFNAVDHIANDCQGGTITSLGNNIMGTTANCSISLQPTDQVTNPLLLDFVDPGSPGQGRFGLSSLSPAIDRDTVCDVTIDQLGKLRPVDGIPNVIYQPNCDIGSVEFYPIVNNLVNYQQSDLLTQYDPTPVPGAPAGVLTLVATIDNRPEKGRPSLPPDPLRNRPIFFLFAEVTTLQLSRQGAALADQPILLNADGGPGRVGARVTPTDSLKGPLSAGKTVTLQFRVGLQTPEPIVFSVDIHGEVR